MGHTLSNFEMAASLPQVTTELAALVAQLTQEQAKRKWAEMRVTQLEEMLRLLRLKKYGPQGESLADVYLPLFDDEPGISLDRWLLRWTPLARHESK